MELSATSVDGCWSATSGSLTVDLSRVRFVLPGGIVAVACLAKAASARGVDVMVKAPADLNVDRYVSRMGLGEVLSDCGLHAPFTVVTHHDRADVLVGCQWADEEGIAGLANMVNDRLWEANVPERTTDLIVSAVFEVADNVLAHSESGGGFICAQTYQPSTRFERIELAVGDIGRGVKASLQQRYNPADDQDALELAIQNNVSGLNPNRGIGLHNVARDIPRAGGRLTIRSGSAYLHVHPGGPYYGSCGRIPGTLVEMRVPVGQLSETR